MSAYTRRTVNWLLRELGCPIRPQGRPPKLTAQGERDLLAAIERGETWRSIRARLGISGNTILRIKRKHQTHTVPVGTQNLTLSLKHPR